MARKRRPRLRRDAFPSKALPWIVCLGHRRYRDEREHPRAPADPMPLEEALDLANTCLNPLGFLAGD